MDPWKLEGVPMGCLDQQGLNAVQNAARPWFAAMLGVGAVNLLLFSIYITAFYFSFIPFFAGIVAVVAGSVVICCGPRDSSRATQWLAAVALSSFAAFLEFVEGCQLAFFIHNVRVSKFWGMSTSSHIGHGVRVAFYFFGAVVCAMAALKAHQAHRASGERAGSTSGAFDAAGADASNVV